MVDVVQPPDDEGFGFLDLVGQEQGREHGCDGERCNQGPRQCVGVGARHRTEDRPFNALHRKERHESGDNDQDGEKDGFVHL